MPSPIRLRIPSPCQEHWGNMQAAEKGRHCKACQKTVIDFTSMSDPEIIRHLAMADKNVCGRLAPDQLNRNLTQIRPAQRNGWSGWRWMLAGLLVTSNNQERHSSADPGRREFRVSPTADSSEEFIMGKLSRPPLGDRTKIDTEMVRLIAPEIEVSSEIMGDIMLTRDDSASEPVDTLQGPHAATKMDSTCNPAEPFTLVGEVVATTKDPTGSLRQIVTDTLAAFRLSPSVDSVKQVMVDTFNKVLGVRKKELLVYPNPASRGSAVHLTWQTEPGIYHVALYSIAGVLVQERVLEVISRSQVDVWEMPAGLTAGSYVFRAVRHGEGRQYSRQVVIE